MWSYPLQLHYMAHTMSAIENKRQSADLTGVRVIFAGLQAIPCGVVLYALLPTLQTHVFVESAIRSQLEATLPDYDIVLLPDLPWLVRVGYGLAIISCALTALALALVIVGHLTVRKRRPAPTVPLDTCRISLANRLVPFLYTLCEVGAAQMQWGAAFNGPSPIIGAVALGAGVAALASTWRWWTSKVPGGEQCETAIMALLFSWPNLFGVLFTAGTATHNNDMPQCTNSYAHYPCLMPQQVTLSCHMPSPLYSPSSLVLVSSCVSLCGSQTSLPCTLPEWPSQSLFPYWSPSPPAAGLPMELPLAQ